MQEEISLKSRKILPILLSVMATFGITTAVSVTASAAEVTKSPEQYKQTAQSGLATPKISKAESVYEGVKLSWNDVDGAALYRVYYKGKNGWTKLTDTTETSCIDNDVYSGGNYTYTVRCITEDGKHFASGYDSKGTKLTYIAAPEISKTESVNSGEKLTWNKVKGAEKYRVYFKNGKKWTRIGDTTSTSLVHKNVVSGRSYTYTVRCISDNAKSFTSDFNHNGTETTYIGTPQISNIESVNGGVKLSWSSVNGAEMYRVYYKGRNGWTKLVDTTETACFDSDVLSGNHYTYTVRCISNDARKHQSGYDKNGKSLKYIAAPKVTKTDVTYNSVNLTWNKVKGAEKYRVYRRNGNTWKRIADTTSTSVTDKNLSAEKSYTYTVRCITANGKKFASGYDSKGFTATTSPIPPVIFDKTSITLGTTETYTLKNTVENGTLSQISFTTSNSKVADIDNNGKITAVDVGTAKITAKTYNGKTASCTVTVKKLADSITLNKTSITLGVGEQFDLNSSIPNNTTAYYRLYYSDSTAIATVQKSGGLITAKTAGTTTVRCKLNNGKEAICKVTVKSAPSSVSLNHSSSTLKVGQSQTLTAAYNSNAYSYRNTWTSSNTYVATVNSSGKISAKSQGTATITYKTYNGKTAKCKITVSGSAVKCLDVSTWQGSIDFNKVKSAGYNYVIIRAGYGKEKSQKDNMFEINYKNAKAAGLKVGAYWFSYAMSPSTATAEADACLSCIKGKKFELPVYYDMEYQPAMSTSNSNYTKMAVNFCNKLKSNGFKSGVYSSASVYDYLLNRTTLKNNGISIWNAEWYTKPSISCDVWQYSDNGRINGISTAVDLNYIYNLNIVG